MTTGSAGLTERCICGHPAHSVRCPCGCRVFIAVGPHPDQSRGGALPAVLVLVVFVVLVLAGVAVAARLHW